MGRQQSLREAENGPSETTKSAAFKNFVARCTNFNGDPRTVRSVETQNLSCPITRPDKTAKSELVLVSRLFQSSWTSARGGRARTAKRCGRSRTKTPSIKVRFQGDAEVPQPREVSSFFIKAR
jgi:hypothetical protein